ncbi:MAG: general secretion pathway protein GspB [Pseudomonadota bacterium]
MSYILEALKKSQAERQLGSAPTINAVPVGAAPHADLRPSRRPLWIALSAAALAVALALLAWRLMAPAPKAAVAVLAATPPPVGVAVTVAVAPPPLAVVPPSAPQEPKRVVARPAPPAPVKAAAPPPPPPPPSADEDKLPTLRELPEAIQRTVPPLTFGGYMYSKNPADRLLLIDKSLRREGEEVAPGLVLEKLLPKAAVMNFNGYRYRVPY